MNKLCQLISKASFATEVDKAEALKLAAAMKDQIITVGAHRWLVREAVSLEDALDAIGFAGATGSVGTKDVLDETLCGGGVSVRADVVRLNPDGSECKPC